MFKYNVLVNLPKFILLKFVFRVQYLREVGLELSTIINP